MEKDDAVKGGANSLDFGARIFDPRVGRWMSVDPLQKKYPSLTSFGFVNNSPLILVDPTGRIVEPAPNLTDAQKKRVKAAIKKLQEERPKQYAYLNSLRWHPDKEKFISSEDEDYDSMKEDAIPIVIHISVANLDGTKKSKEKKEYRNRASRSGQTVNNKSGMHTDGQVEKSRKFFIKGAFNDAAYVTTPEGENIRVPFKTPYQDFGENKPMFEYLIRETEKGGNHFLITLDDFNYGNNGTSGDMTILSHELGHVEGEVSDIRGAAFDQAYTGDEEKPGHDFGQKSGKIADKRETSDRK